MKSGKPRYSNNLFISDEKHLTRTINTYIEYESVIELYLSFNTKVDKYQIHPVIEIEDKINIPDDALLVYDRVEAFENRTDTNKIFSILDSLDIQELYSDSLLSDAKQLIKKYEKSNPINIFFDSDKKEEVLQELQKLFSYIKGSYIQKPSGKKVNNSKMVAVRFYNTLLNKLNYQGNISTLKNATVITQQQRIQKVKDEIEHLYSKIESLKFLRSREYDRGVENIAYEDVLIALEFFDNDRIRRAYSHGYNYFELLQERQVHEDNMDAEIIEHNHYIKLHTYVEQAIIHLFYEYIKLSRFTIVDNLRFSKIGIERSLENLAKKVKNSSKLGGIKRRTRILQLQKDYGAKHKEYTKVFNSLSDEKRQFILKKVLLLNKHKRILKELDSNLIDSVFNDENVSFDYESKLKELPEKYITIKEHKEYSNYYELQNEINDLIQEYKDTWEYIDSDTEMEIATKVTELQQELDELNEFYDNWEYPNCIQKFIDDNLKK